MFLSVYRTSEKIAISSSLVKIDRGVKEIFKTDMTQYDSTYKIQAIKKLKYDYTFKL